MSRLVLCDFAVVWREIPSANGIDTWRSVRFEINGKAFGWCEIEWDEWSDGDVIAHAEAMWRNFVKDHGEGVISHGSEEGKGRQTLLGGDHARR